MMRFIHNTNFRMPVILRPEDEQRWLAPELTENEIMVLLKPYPSAKMEAGIIRQDFLKKAYSDPTIIEPVTAVKQ